MLIDNFHVDSPNVRYTDDHITSSYVYDTTELECGTDGKFTVRPQEQSVEFQTARQVPKVGCDAS
jgi:myo-inositol-1-phosphate synthase